MKRWIRKKRKSLRLKIITMAIIPIIVIQLAVGVLSFSAYNKVTANLIIERDSELAELAAEQFATFIYEEKRDMERQGLMWITFEDELDLPLSFNEPEREEENANNHQSFILDAFGQVLLSPWGESGFEGQDWSDRSYFVLAASTLQPALSDIVSDGELGDDVIVLAVPIIDEQGTLAAVTLGIFSLKTRNGGRVYDGFSQLLRIDEDSHTYLVDGNGRVIYHTDARYIGTDMAALSVVQQVVDGQQGAVLAENAGGQQTISSFAPVPGTSWGLIVEDDWSAITQSMWGHQLVLFALLALGVLAPAVVIAAGVKHITAPIEALTRAAREVARGDLEQTITVQTGDEVEDLAKQFNQMAVYLRESYAHLEQRVRERTAQLTAASEQAQRSAEVAEAANRAKSVFLANMSHELRTPLNAILGYSQLMVRDPMITAEQHEYLETIGRSGEHLLGLINDVLTMSKIEAGRTTLQENAFDLHRQLEGLAEMFHMRAADKGLALILDVAPDVPRYVLADEGKLRQVLMNLLSNAVKFTQEGGVTLRVGLGDAPQKPVLRFEVEDTGAGIAPEEMDTLFDPFVQTSSGQNAQEGTGLGLPISQQFVGLMGGKLAADSLVGQGSRFGFAMPVKLAEADEVESYDLQPRQRVTGLEAGQRTYRILVVEDQATNRDLLVKLLTPFGFQVRCAPDGQQGVELWQQWNPELIWMDMRMPIMDGYEATQQIKARAKAEGRTVVIVALTASAFEQDRAEILAAGCDDFVRKPFRENEIFDALTQHLGVRFIYETLEEQVDGEESGAGGDAPTFEALQAALKDLPAAWALDLHQSATQLDADQMLALVEQIRQQAPYLADTLAQWIRAFEYEKILQLTVSPHTKESSDEHPTR